MKTIAAISTPAGLGGIGIVRISGEDALKITKKVFKPKKNRKYKSHTIRYGYIVDENNIVPDTWDEIRTRNTLLKSSVGAVKWTFVKKFKSTAACIEHLNKNKYVSVVTSPHIKGKTNVILQHGDFTQKRLAVWFGNEARGISDEAVENAAACVAIEMYGIIESFNLAVSTGIVLYEITKQRRAYQSTHIRGRKKDPTVAPVA